MMTLSRVLIASAAMLAFAAMCGFAPVPDRTPLADFIVTAAPVYKPLAELRGEERFPAGAQLQLVHNGKTQPLVSDFSATAYADVSYDGKSVLFAGKKRRTILGRFGS